MKKYIKRYINNQSGLADHIQVSSEPTHDHIEPSIPATILVEIPGGEPVPEPGYKIEEIEIEESAKMRARDYLSIFNKSRAEQDADSRFTEVVRKPLRDIIIP